MTIKVVMNHSEMMFTVDYIQQTFTCDSQNKAPADYRFIPHIRLQNCPAVICCKYRSKKFEGKPKKKGSMMKHKDQC